MKGTCLSEMSPAVTEMSLSGEICPFSEGDIRAHAPFGGGDMSPSRDTSREACPSGPKDGAAVPPMSRPVDNSGAPDSITLTLPWPPAELSPNRGAHFRVKARAKKRYREACYLATLSQGARRGCMPLEGPIPLTITFHPPSRHRRDLDNAVAAMKAGFDGMADAMGVDDSRFTWAEPPRLADQLGGFVRIEVSL